MIIEDAGWGVVPQPCSDAPSPLMGIGPAALGRGSPLPAHGRWASCPGPRKASPSSPSSASFLGSGPLSRTGPFSQTPLGALPLA